MTETETSSGEQPWRARTAVLALGTFVVGTDGFIIVGLLPEIHETLGVSTAAAGQLVSVFAFSYALLGPVLATLTGLWPRRRALVTGVALLAVGNAVAASAHVYGLVLASRVLSGCGAALFVASAVATAAHLAGDQRRGRAISMVTAGATLSLVLGAPLGTLVGGAWGWQTAIWLVAAVAAVVAVVLTFLLPPIKLDQSATLRQRITPLTDRRVLRILIVTLLAFIGIFLPFTYMSVVFAPALDHHESRLALLLLVFGIAATAGNLAAGSLADRYGPRRVVIGATLGVAAVFLIMLPIRDVFLLVVIAQALSGIVSYSVIGPQQYRIIAYAPPGGASLVTSLNTSTGYLGQFLASVIGAGLLTATSSAVLLPVAAGFAALAALLTWWLSQAGRKGDGEAASETGKVATSPAK
ncbi:MFS transporter [Micromonospora qiuiae]|uniref:MFS transporter n=1 Tax=Micromonospora qiuiae TaxID=502268 RepID=A0ABQ4JLH5_9ACTN|nr:MFS transporter [Micromonospora qiuiae]GIJ30416.1 MFS transporter [Micromonospora qiuiae]